MVYSVCNSESVSFYIFKVGFRTDATFRWKYITYLIAIVKVESNKTTNLARAKLDIYIL